LDITKNKYLITVSIDSLKNIDLSKSIALGEWCIPYKNRIAYKNIEVLDFIWNDRSKYEEAYYYCLEIFEKLLSELKDDINKNLNVNFSIDYYRLILSPWLIHYIHQAYDKYVSIKQAYSKNKNLITYILDEKDYYIPLDYQDFMYMITKNEIYNLQQYSQIVKFLNYDYKYIDTNKKNEQKLYYKNNNSMKRKLVNFVDKTFLYISNMLYRKEELTTVCEPYFLYDATNRYKLVLKSGFKIILNDFNYNYYIDLTLDMKKREKKCEKNKDKTFINYLRQVILKDIPLIYFENLLKFRDKVLSFNIHKTNIFYTANAHYGNEIYKFYIAENYKNTKTIISQHGGVNGTHLLSLEEIDHKMADYIFTFGWKDKKNEIPMYSFNISLLKRKFKHKPDPKKILFISTGQPRRLFRFHSSYSATEYKKLIQQSIDFLSIINCDVVYRKYQEHYGWFTEEQIEKGINRHLIYDINKKIIKSYQTADIVVSNHIGSTYLESISLNIPTVVFCDESVTKFRESASEIYKILTEVGIFHKSGYSAAKFINLLYDENRLYEWWHSSDVIEAKTKLINKYSNITDSWFIEFKNKTTEILKYKQ